MSDAAADCGPWAFRLFVIAVAIVAMPILVVLAAHRCLIAAYEEMCDTVLPDIRFLVAAFVHCIKTGKQA